MTQLHHVQVKPAPITRHVVPDSVETALELLARHGERSRLVAGGTDLLLELARNGRPDIDTLVDVSRIRDSSAITDVDGTISLGLNTTHGDIVASSLLQRSGLPLAQACLEIGSPQLRNRATVGGNVVTASPANDTISALLAMDATVTIRNASGSRVIPIADLYDGFRSTVLGHSDLVTAISFPALTSSRRGIFVKLGNRTAQAISVVLCAVVAEHDAEGRVVDLRVALGSVAPTVILVPGLEPLRGRPLSSIGAEAGRLAAESVTPIDDVRATAQYRADTIAVLVERAISSLAAGEEAATWPAVPPLLRSPHGPASRTAGVLDLVADTPITCVVNGSPREASGAVGVTLLDWIRDSLHLTGTKEGCAEGECGACTVHLDGEAVLACLVPAALAEGCSVATIEGIAADGELDPVQNAFDRCGGVQCGFCTPGFVMSAAMLTREYPTPSRDQVVHGLAGNLCRCTGYYGIVEAVMTALAPGEEIR